MTPTLINILIRTSGRPKLFARCMESVFAQTYRHIRIIVAYDNFDDMSYIKPFTNVQHKHVELLKVVPQKNYPYYWNLYCNALKDLVKDGFMLYLDDDDVFCDNNAITRIISRLTDEHRAYIFQFDRCGIIKPSKEQIANSKIERGKIGMPCIILNHRIKNLVNFDGEKGADYRFIKQLSELTDIKFNEGVIVKCDNNGMFGAKEN